MTVALREFEHGYLVAVRGFVSAEVAREVVDAVTRVLRRRNDVYAFQDWFEVTGYESRARLIVSDATVRFRKRLRALHVGVSRDPMVSMGASVINVVVGGFIEIHSSAQSFAAAQNELLGAELQAPGRAPTGPADNR